MSPYITETYANALTPLLKEDGRLINMGTFTLKGRGAIKGIAEGEDTVSAVKYKSKLCFLSF